MKTLNNAGMIFHPPNLETIEEYIINKYPFLRVILRKIPLATKKEMLSRLSPSVFFSTSEMQSIVGTRIVFIGLLLPLLPDQLVANDKEMIRQRILKICKMATKRNVGILTLGAFTSIVTDQGKDLVGKTHTNITSGNTYTAALCVKSIFKVAEYLKEDMSNLRIGIIGATGDIGSACAKFLAPHVKQIVLCSRKINETVALVEIVSKSTKLPPVVVKEYKDAIKKCDIAICATSSFDVLFEPKDVNPGTIICDLSVPANIGKNLIEQRNDVIAYQGGRAKFLNYDLVKNKIWKQLFPQNSIFGCLAESLILAFEKRFEDYSVGRGNITEARINEIFSLGLKHGFDVAEFHYLDHSFDRECFNRIKDIRKNG